MKSGTIVIAALTLAASACGQHSPKAPAKLNQPALEGYADLKFGMTFDEGTAATHGYSFDATSMKDCLAQLAVRGCVLRPESDLTTYRTVEGVPYGLELAFNAHDKLTDIYLDYSRNADRDPAERISQGDCLSIHERTTDWVIAQYGEGFVDRADKPRVPNRTTPRGNRYYFNEDDGIVVIVMDKKLPNGRVITLMTTFFKVDGQPSCEVEVVFREKESVERWKMSDAQQAEADRIEHEVKSLKQAGAKDDADSDFSSAVDAGSEAVNDFGD